MTGTWALAALWLGLALIATLLSIWFRIATALSEIVVGTIAQLVIGAFLGAAILGADDSWIKFLSGTGSILLTFLAGAELDPGVFRQKWREAAAVGLASFAFPFLGCAAAARYGLGWDVMPSLLAGVALSTTSVAVVYAVLLETGLNITGYGKTVLAACFITDLGTVLALGLIFAPFTEKTAVFVGVGILAFVVLPWLTPRFFKLYGDRPSELEAKFLLLVLFAMGALASWADSEAVLPAYVIGMVLARSHRRAERIRPSARRQDCQQVHRRLSRDDGLPLAEEGGDVHDTADVDRPHLRHDLGALRPVARHHRRRPVFVACRRRHRQRRHSDLDRQRVLPAAPSTAEPLSPHAGAGLGCGQRGCGTI